LRNLRAGKGALDLRFEGDQLEVLSNTTGFEVAHRQAPPVPLEGAPLART